MVPVRLSDLWPFLAQEPIPTSESSDKYALYGMVAALGTAFIYGVVSIITNKMGKVSGAPASRKVAREHEAWERFLLMNGFDPRRIKTGYETMEEASRASP